MDKLERLITLTLNKYKGGELFFDNLDNNLADEELIHQLLKKYTLYDKSNNIVVTGQFGLFFWDYFGESYENILLFNGSLRSNGMPDLKRVKGSYTNNSFYLIDDSYYSGITQKKIQRFLSSYNSEIKKVYVLYDGSINQDFNVLSLYRFYH